MFEDRLIYEGYVDRRLARWKADLDELKAKAERVEADMQVHYDQSIDALQHKHDEVSHHLSSLRGANDEAWEAVRASTGKGWLEFKSLLYCPTGKSIFLPPMEG